MSDSANPAPAAKLEPKPRALFPLLGRGIIAREARAALPVVLALALIFCLYLGWAELATAFSPGKLSTWALTSAQYAWLNFIQGTAFILAVLCGAEERESGTDQFLSILPIGRDRIFREKLLGSWLGVVAFVLLSAGGATLVLLFSHEDFFGAVQNFYQFKRNELILTLFQGVAVYSFGLATGVLIGRVLIAVFAGAAAVILYYAAIYWITLSCRIVDIQRDPDMLWFLLPGTLGALLIANLRFTGGIRRDGSLSAPGRYDLAWKERRERRWIFWSVVLAGGVMILVFRGSFERPQADPQFQTILFNDALPGSLDFFNRAPPQEHILIALSFIAAAILLSVRTFSRGELEPAHGFVYSLPIARSELLYAKLRPIAIDLLWLGIAMSIVVMVANNDIRLAEIKLSAGILLAGGIAALVTVCVQLHVRSLIVSLFLSALASVLVLLAINAGNLIEFHPNTLPLTRMLIVQGLGFAAMLAAVYAIYVRSPTLELTDGKRLGLLFLWIATAAELLLIAFHCNLRDLVFILFGF